VVSAGAIDVERNPGARHVLDEAPSRAPLRFHRALPGYAPTPLRDVPALAERLGVGRVWLKDESWRLGLPAFKVVGASWAVARALEPRLTRPFVPEEGLDGLRAALASGDRPTLVAATDGNHGRAVARMAALLGLPARIFVAEDMVAARRAAIASEGAEVVVVAGGYDRTVARSAREADADAVVVSDTAWEGYRDVPTAVIEGYATVLWEIDDALRGRGEPDPDLVLVQAGVGAFGAAVVRHYRRPGLERPPRIVVMEPTQAACVLASVRAGRVVTLPGEQHSIMSGLNCGTPSPLAFPVLAAGVDLFVAADDDLAREGMRTLAEQGIVGGECSGGGVGAAEALLRGDAREALGVGRDARVLLFSTEGATDPEGYEAVVGRPAQAVAAAPG
jgi:diaminopropionate ammonia-lyase